MSHNMQDIIDAILFEDEQTANELLQLKHPGHILYVNQTGGVEIFCPKGSRLVKVELPEK